MLDDSDPGGDTSTDSDTSPNTFYKAYIKPECDEPNAESASRSRLIQQRIRLLKRHKKTYSNNVSNFEFQLDFPETHQNHPRIPPTHIEVLFDTGASITMLPGQFTFAWTNVRPSLNTIRGCFKGNDTHDSQIGEFHALLTLSSTETVRIVIPEAILLPPGVANNYLLANIPFLMAGHQVHCDLHKPKLVFKGGGQYVMDVKRGHYVIKLLPVATNSTTSHRTIILHPRHPYDPPTYVNNITHSQNMNRPSAKTPTAFVYHLRFGCPCSTVLQRTHQHVNGMQVQQDSWKRLQSLLPCSACIAGKMRKPNKASSASYTDITNLALSWTPSSTQQDCTPNHHIACDWGIINKRLKRDQNNVFALFLDLLTGWTFVFPAQNRGLAGESLLAYIKEHGPPKIITHDNAQEYLHGDFKDICTQHSIQQKQSAPHTPNQNPTEHYMEIIQSKTRSLLFISGLDIDKFWEHALLHAVSLQNRTALPGRCTPYELSFSKRPDISHIRIFGCEALSYLEKDKRNKFSCKAERTIYLGISPQHSDDTHKLFSLTTQKVIFRRTVVFNERCFPARTTPSHGSPILSPNASGNPAASGTDLLGLTFIDDDEEFRITGAIQKQGLPCLEYVNTKTKEEFVSTAQEVRDWYNRTHLSQAANTLQPSRSSFLTDLATTMYQQVQRKYDVKLDPLTTSPPKNYNDARNRELQWFEAEAKERDGMLRFNTWTRIPQNQITPTIRRYALRAHHIYSLKRDGTAKNRVVVNGRRQHESTYSDTTSPVATQLLTRLTLAIAAYRRYTIAQMDLTNAYLHANIKDKIFIIIPAGFPGEGEVARLDKATYGTKQGARRFYDHTLQVLTTIGMTQSMIEPCLFRMLSHGKEAFLILYVDDALIHVPQDDGRKQRTQLKRPWVQ